MAADNDLTSFVHGDMREILTGSMQLTSTQKVLILVDKQNENPYFLEVNNGDTVRIKKRISEDLKSSDPQLLNLAMNVLTTRYSNAESFGLVLWGHANGWTIEKNEKESSSVRKSTPRKAYGLDSQGNWMNITDMAAILSKYPKLAFIFADCCVFQCIESAYELRNNADYIIASAAEIPGEGAPYNTVLPALFNTTSNFYEQVVDAYYEQDISGWHEPMSVIKTSELDDLATSTYNALSTFLPLEKADEYLNVSGLIYYYDGAHFDMQDFMMRFVSDENAYNEWKRVFDKTVVYKTYVDDWMARHIINAFDFSMEEERYGGVSMFVPQNPNKRSKFTSFYDGMNKNISQMAWYNAARLYEFGW